MNSAPETFDGLDLHEVAVPKGPPARAIVLIGLVSLLTLLYAVYGALTGSLGPITLVALAVGVLGLLYTYKQTKGAEAGDPHELKKKLAGEGRSGSVPKPSVRPMGSLLDI
ncbi:MAG: hypothetical protein P8N02_10815 [Actinomycetota bacterium]|nr:hypothetical protein [Actinomycetota bacterium]